jgi:hypothetical protein
MTLDLSGLKTKTPECNISAWLETHPEDQDDIVRVLRDVRYSNGLVSDVLRANGLSLSKSQVGNHRLDRCQSCTQKGLRYGPEQS